jgi:hypothetical protein
MKSSMFYPPIITVGQPPIGMAPQPQGSVTRKAGLPPIITMELPRMNGDEGMWLGGGMGQTWVSPITAAGMPPIITVETPGPMMTPPWLVGSPTLAAAAISSVFLYWFF